MDRSWEVTLEAIALALLLFTALIGAQVEFVLAAVLLVTLLGVESWQRGRRADA